MNESKTYPPVESKKLLLCSLREFQSIIEPVLAAATPRRICEIGVDKGVFTSFLVDFCRNHDCHYSGIDPTLPETLTKGPQDDHVTFIKSTSLDALSQLPSQDVYFVDGDHNYYTVLNELRRIFSHTGASPIVFLHDVGWPWGRRDQYCSPESIPPEARQPYSSTKGAAPGHVELQDWGFRGEGSDYSYAAAATEGGKRNGVLTAVEDAISELRLTNHRLVVIPAVFGLGILYDPGKCSSGVNDFLAAVCHGLEYVGPLLTALEENRIDLFLSFLQCWQHSREMQAAYGELSGHSRDLQEKYEALVRHSGDLQGKI